MTTTDRPRSRRRHPAVSARILALGLSTIATLAMVAGYSLAEARTLTTPSIPVSAPSVAPESVSASGSPPSMDAPPRNPAVASAASPTPQVSSPAAMAPSVTAAAPVIEIPVPAVPAPSGGNTQTSSGSN